MPQGNDYFSDTKEAMRMFIPLVLNDRNLQLQRDQMAQQERLKQDDLALQERRLQEEAKRKMDEYTLRTLGNMAEKFIAEGDTENLKKLAPHFQKYGIDFSGLAPMAKTEKGPSNEWDALNRWSGGDPARAAELYRRFHPEKSDKSLSADEILWGASGRDVEKFLGFKQRLQKTDGGGEEKIPPEVQAALRIMQMKPTDSLDPMMATLMESMKPGSSTSYMEQQQKTGRGELNELQAMAAPLVKQYFSKGAPGTAAPAPGKAPAGEMKEMPPASEHKGRILRNKTDGTRYRSDGAKWVEIK